ncbi:MAG: hypothetical protein ACREB8_16090 [Pseudolabrys sp.]
MPTRHPQTPAARSSPPRARFRERYDEIEARRTALVARLATLSEAGKRHPAFKRASTLLNATFRRSKLGQRLAILQAAAWLIDVLEKLTAMS